MTDSITAILAQPRAALERMQALEQENSALRMEPVHRIDPFAVATLCGATGNWKAVNTPAGVTCPACLAAQATK
jgi:hypothetical protein